MFDCCLFCLFVFWIFSGGSGLRKKATLAAAAGGGVAKPVPPPRDHLRIEEDGRLVNRAAPPQVPYRVSFFFLSFFFFTEFFLLGNPIFIVRKSYRVLPVLASYRFALPSFVTEFFVTRHRSPFPGLQVLAWCRCCLTEFRLPSLPLSASRFDNEADLSCSVGLSCLELEIKIPSRRCQHVELNLKPSGLRVTELLPSKLPRPLVSYYRVGGANIYGGSWFLVVADAGAGERSAAHQSGRRRNRHAQRPTTRTDTQISGPCRLV